MCQSQPLWIWLKSCKYFSPHKVHSGFVDDVVVSTDLLRGSEELWGEDGKQSKGCNFQPGIEAAILSNLKNSIKSNLLGLLLERVGLVQDTLARAVRGSWGD